VIMWGGAFGTALALVWLLNYADAIFTIAWVQMGVAEEANPLMAEVIDRPALFLLTKLSMVTLGCILLWRFRAAPLSRYMVVLALICYTIILVIHTNIAFSLERVPLKECLESFL